MNIKFIGANYKNCQDCECSVCFEKVNKKDVITLECGHTYHNSCLTQWEIKKYENTTIDMKIPVRHRTIHCFNEGENIFTCPYCRMEHTHDFKTSTIKPALARIHMMENDKKVIHYITNPMETIAYVPRKDVEGDFINDRWAVILAVLKKGWENGRKDIYAIKKDNEISFTFSNLCVPSQNKDGKFEKIPESQDKKERISEIVDINEIHLLLEGF